MKKPIYTSENIAEGNDFFRQNFLSSDLMSSKRYRVKITSDISSSGYLLAILEAVRNYDSFNQENDPSGEHAFGGFEVGDQAYVFFIEYFDSHFDWQVDPAKTVPCRNLQIMTRSEYEFRNSRKEISLLSFL